MKIVVACGGTSPEREVSLNSGRAVACALSSAGHSVLLEDVVSPGGFIKKWEAFGADGVFIALHGDWGEDGRFQASLESFGIPYTGSGPEACMYAMDKNVSKFLAGQAGLRVPEGTAVKRGAVDQAEIEGLLEKFGRIVIKPYRGGSSVGVTFASNLSEAFEGLELCWRSYEHDGIALAERYIPGREITVAVMESEDGGPVALPAIDIRPKAGFYDYANKYTKGSTDYLCPAPFSDVMRKRIGKAAAAAHDALGCRSYSRADFRVTDDDEIYFIEENTAPGMTATSLVPKAARAAGYEFADFLEILIKRSFSRKGKFEPRGAGY